VTSALSADSKVTFDTIAVVPFAIGELACAAIAAANALPFCSSACLSAALVVPAKNRDQAWETSVTAAPVPALDGTPAETEADVETAVERVVVADDDRGDELLHAVAARRDAPIATQSRDA